MTRFLSVFVTAALVAVVASVSEAKAIEVKMVKATDVTIGTERQLVVDLNRDGEMRVLKLRFLDLPKGVTVKSISIPSNQSKATITLVATKDAELVEARKVRVFVDSDDKAALGSSEFTLKVHK